MLDVHPPHAPTHTWKDFFLHIATIVVGLLIAIGLEQTVEYFHHRQELRKEREELRTEVEINRRNSAAQVECIHLMQAELKADMALLLDHRVTNQPLHGILRFDWTFRRTQAAAWNANRQSGATNLMPHDELHFYDYLFTVNEVVMDSAEKWQVELETARAIATRASDGTLSPQDTNELITAISDTQGKLARTERLIAYAQQGAADHQFDQ